ncbi:MAG TPA: hypothetical protein VLU25_07795 [Acidobacteriota bacterium]|nr:hypothetical protein [Acidobacteriota bacterium]
MANESDDKEVRVEQDISATTQKYVQVPVLKQEEIEDNVLIGVCGVQASGKTVFLSSIFHNVNGIHVKGVGRVTLDTKDKGGETYFRWVEETIRREGKTEPTDEPAVARLLINTDSSDFQRGLILFDFAGGHFTAFADIGSAIRSADSLRKKAELRLVGTYLEQCDALIVLIDASQFQQKGRPSATSPFSPSVIYLRDYCAKENKPIALAFTKNDLNPDLTLDKVQEFGRIKEFNRIFSSDSSDADRPFGRVQVLTCYEIDPGYGTALQRDDGSIWLPQSKDLFVEILRAAWPSAQRRLEGIVERRETEAREEEEKQRIARHRKRLKVALVVLLILMVAAAPLVWNFVQGQLEKSADSQSLTSAANLLRQAQPESISEGHFQAIDRLRGDSSKARKWAELESAYQALLADLPVSVYRGTEQRGAADSLLRLRSLAGRQDSRTLDMLSLHRDLLDAQSVSRPVDLAMRLHLVKRVQALAGEPRNRDLLEVISEAADKVLKSSAEEIAAPGYETTNLLDRVTWIREQLLDDRKRDPGLRAELRACYARLLGAGMGGLADRERMVEFLLKASPEFKVLLSSASHDFKQLVEYRFIYESIEKSGTGELARVRSAVGSLLADLVARERVLQTTLEYTMNQLYLAPEIDSQEASDLWHALFEGMDSEFLFELKDNAWPPRQRPWQHQLRADLSSGKYSPREAKRVIGELSKHPLYWKQVRTLAEAVGDRYFALEKIRLFSEFLEGIKGGSGVEIRASAKQIRAIGALAGRIHQERLRQLKIDNSSLIRSRDEGYQLADLLEQVPYTRDTDYVGSSRVQNEIIRFCRSQMREFGIDCGG